MQFRLLSALTVAACASPAFGSAITLGNAASFAVLGASTVTNTGASTLSGNLGLYPGTSVTGSSTITLNGASTININNGVAQAGQADALTAYNSLQALAADATLTGDTLGTGGTVLSLTPGVYFYASSAQLTGALTLDFQGLSDQAIIIQIGSTLTTASGSMVSIINPGSNDAVFWAVGTSAILGTTTAFIGNILADQSVTLTTGATDSCGSIIGLTGAVTMDTNTVAAGCATSAAPGSAPEPCSGFLLLLGFPAILLLHKRNPSRG